MSTLVKILYDSLLTRYSVQDLHLEIIFMETQGDNATSFYAEIGAEAQVYVEVLAHAFKNWEIPYAIISVDFATVRRRLSLEPASFYVIPPVSIDMWDAAFPRMASSCIAKCTPKVCIHFPISNADTARILCAHWHEGSSRWSQNGINSSTYAAGHVKCCTCCSDPLTVVDEELACRSKAFHSIGNVREIMRFEWLFQPKTLVLFLYLLGYLELFLWAFRKDQSTSECRRAFSACSADGEYINKEQSSLGIIRAHSGGHDLFRVAVGIAVISCYSYECGLHPNTVKNMMGINNFPSSIHNSLFGLSKKMWLECKAVRSQSRSAFNYYYNHTSTTKKLMMLCWYMHPTSSLTYFDVSRSAVTRLIGFEFLLIIDVTMVIAVLLVTGAVANLVEPALCRTTFEPGSSGVFLGLFSCCFVHGTWRAVSHIENNCNLNNRSFKAHYAFVFVASVFMCFYLCFFTANLAPKNTTIWLLATGTSVSARLVFAPIFEGSVLVFMISVCGRVSPFRIAYVCAQLRYDSPFTPEVARLSQECVTALELLEMYLELPADVRSSDTCTVENVASWWPKHRVPEDAPSLSSGNSIRIVAVDPRLHIESLVFRVCSDALGHDAPDYCGNELDLSSWKQELWTTRKIYYWIDFVSTQRHQYRTGRSRHNDVDNSESSACPGISVQEGFKVASDPSSSIFSGKTGCFHGVPECTVDDVVSWLLGFDPHLRYINIC